MSMNKRLLIIQIALITLLILKVAIGGHLFGKTLSSMNESKGLKSTEHKGFSAEQPKDLLDINITKERELYNVLEKKLKEVEDREANLRAQEQALLALKREIEGKIDQLMNLEKRIEQKLEVEKEEETKRYKQLAKIYESASPVKAAAILEKLDTKTAAGIAMNMKRDKAGAVISAMNTAKAIEITRELTKFNFSIEQK
ncbi:MAG: hypothetical protein N2317_03740 [Syntrophales bacterium]|nr:hypothetical protein [Syntrophales bacterium]